MILSSLVQSGQIRLLAPRPDGSEQLLKNTVGIRSKSGSCLHCVVSVPCWCRRVPSTLASAAPPRGTLAVPPPSVAAHLGPHVLADVAPLSLATAALGHSTFALPLPRRPLSPGPLSLAPAAPPLVTLAVPGVPVATRPGAHVLDDVHRIFFILFFFLIFFSWDMLAANSVRSSARNPVYYRQRVCPDRTLCM